MALDPEKDGVEVSYVKGYPSLAAFIASDLDHSSVLYKRFDKLSARNILYLQSELAELERRQDEFDKEDLLDDDLAAKRATRDWRSFKDAATISSSKAEQRMRLVMEVRARIKEYKEAILLDSALFALRRPTMQTYQAFRNHFMNVGANGAEYPTLGGSSASVYDDRDDTVAIARPMEEDRLTRFLRNECPLLFLEKRRPKGSSFTKGSPLTYISARRISIVVGIINVVLAATFLFGAIYNLYYVEKDQVKLGLIAGYTIAFALCISLVTNAKRSETFGACAAYAAVLVVFVSGSLGGSVTLSTAQQSSGVT